MENSMIAVSLRNQIGRQRCASIHIASSIICVPNALESLIKRYTLNVLVVGRCNVVNAIINNPGEQTNH